MAINYTFPTNTNPESSFWDGAITNVTSDGSKWVFAGGAAAHTKTSNRFTINSSNDLEVSATFNMPNTNSSYNGILLMTSDYNYQLNVHKAWEKKDGTYWVRTVIGGTTSWISTGTTGQITAKIIIKKDGSGEVYVNDVLKTTAPAGSFSNRTFSLQLNKYTESAGYVYSGYVKSPISSEANFMTFFNQYL